MTIVQLYWRSVGAKSPRMSDTSMCWEDEWALVSRVKVEEVMETRGGAWISKQYSELYEYDEAIT